MRHRTFDESEDMACYVQGWDIDLMQVDAGRFNAEHVVAGDGPVLLQGGSMGRALIQRGACPPRPTFCMPAQPDQSWVFRGRARSAAEMTLVHPGEELSVRSDAGFQICSVSVDEEHLRNVARGIGLDRTADAAMRNHWTRPHDDAMTAARRAWQRLSAGPDRNASSVLVAEWKRQLEVDLIRILLRALATAAGPAEFEAARAMDRVIRGIESALDQRPRHAFTVRELADHVGTSERTLRRAVKAWFGEPITKIVRTRRLYGARRDLRTGRANVTGVALSWGFDHLGRFAGEYRALFGETPSQTLARNQPS
ncbi:MAG: helix-turn-helix transcriptional regulator [Planctomycetota bacterium]